MEVNPELMRALTGGQFVESACSADTASIYNLTECYWAGRSPFCDIVIAESPEYGKVLFLDKEIQSAESDEAIYHEHLVHPALNALADRSGKRVLIVGGGEGATAREVLKWSSVAAVDWVDIDHYLVDLCRRHLSWADDPVYNDPRLRYFGEDIRTFWASNTDLYDLIVLDLPDPDVEDLCAGTMEDDGDYALYSPRFFQVLRSHLTTDGVFVSHCGPVAPGGDPSMRRAGLEWIRTQSTAIGFNTGAAYHTFIPSFQSQWGFFMSTCPSDAAQYPSGLAVMDLDAQTHAFSWPAFWNSPYLGHAQRLRAALRLD